MERYNNNNKRKGFRKPRNRQDKPTIRDIAKLKIWRDIPPPIPKAPRGPSPGALMTTRQFTTTFNTSTNASGGYISQNGATAKLGAIAFRLDDLAQVTTFSSLFDQYRIERIHLRFVTRNPAPQMAAIASPNQTVPLLTVVVDRDDSSAPSSLTDLQEYDNAIQLSAASSADVELIPSITPAVFASGAFSGYSVQRSDQLWLDIANTAVPHFGVKFGISPLQATSTYAWAWDLQAWFTVSFKNSR